MRLCARYFWHPRQVAWRNWNCETAPPPPTTTNHYTIMCVKDAEQVDQEEFESLDNNNNKKPGPLHCEVLRTQMEKWEKESPLMSSTARISPERSCPVRIPIPWSFFCTGFVSILYRFFLEDSFPWNWVLILFVSSCGWWLVMNFLFGSMVFVCFYFLFFIFLILQNGFLFMGTFRAVLLLFVLNTQISLGHLSESIWAYVGTILMFVALHYIKLSWFH